MDFSFLPKYKWFFINGAKNTILISICTVIVALIPGILLALMRLSKNKGLRFVASSYIEFIRGTPLLVQLFIIYYGLPNLGIHFPEIPVLNWLLGTSSADFTAGVITLAVNSTAYLAEIFRAGIQAIDKGQMEAARSLGMPHWMAMVYIIIPQAFRNILPALGNEMVVLIKESSIVSVIGIHELTYNADTVRGNTFKPFEPLLVSALLYFMMTFPLSKLLAYIERRMRAGD